MQRERQACRYKWSISIPSVLPQAKPCRRLGFAQSWIKIIGSPRRLGAPLLFLLAGIFRRPGGELLSGCPERSQWPRPPSLGPSGQFTLRGTKGRHSVELRPFGLVLHAVYPYPLCPCGTSPPDRGSRPPGPPFTGVTPLQGQKISGARKYERCPAISPGPTGGLAGWKIFRIAVPRPRLDVQSQRSRSLYCRTNRDDGPHEGTEPDYAVGETAGK